MCVVGSKYGKQQKGGPVVQAEICVLKSNHGAKGTGRALAYTTSTMLAGCKQGC